MVSSLAVADLWPAESLLDLVVTLNRGLNNREDSVVLYGGAACISYKSCRNPIQVNNRGEVRILLSWFRTKPWLKRYIDILLDVYSGELQRFHAAGIATWGAKGYVHTLNPTESLSPRKVASCRHLLGWKQRAWFEHPEPIPLS